MHISDQKLKDKESRKRSKLKLSNSDVVVIREIKQRRQEAVFRGKQFAQW